MDISLQGLYQWIQEQAKYGLFIVLIFLVLYFAAKRAWIGMVGCIIGLAGVGIFILNPDIISEVATWFGEKLNMS
ncbi:TcpD family membrane protein [Gracilibacillus thailandensis]|uniref:Uncharacterized protein n=1 Tax=Gracilibacillus thailandensis TaxID=563735 RepID=A0A6N7QVW0_9BACI|nr:TcpD family membrane protein [Gracilibacillus thailandensis]MRI66148.1 hypothetical protein [Gracilibacillus thailandensis]